MLVGGHGGSPSLQAGPGDDDLNPGFLDHFRRAGQGAQALKPAAVLIGIRNHPARQVIFTTRTRHLASHGGQVSFPGGKIDHLDAGAAAAAVREAHEEIGMDAGQFEPIGFLDTYVTRTGYTIQPVVGFVDQGFVARPSHDEVEDVFEVPLDFLMDTGHLTIHSRRFEGRDRRFYAIQFEDRFIWGATAGILKNLQTRLLA
jgi:8-oxo-dGTP pyrophosphatase MutT (NUDIX family)